MRLRNGRPSEMRLDEFRRFRHADMGVDIDGHALRPHFAPRLAVLARCGLVVLVPLLGHWASLNIAGPEARNTRRVRRSKPVSGMNISAPDRVAAFSAVPRISNPTRERLSRPRPARHHER